MCNMHVMRGEVKNEQLMSDSIINLRGPSKSHKDISRFCGKQDSVSSTRLDIISPKTTN